MNNPNHNYILTMDKIDFKKISKVKVDYKMNYSRNFEYTKPVSEYKHTLFRSKVTHDMKLLKNIKFPNLRYHLGHIGHKIYYSIMWSINICEYDLVTQTIKIITADYQVNRIYEYESKIYVLQPYSKTSNYSVLYCYDKLFENLLCAFTLLEVNYFRDMIIHDNKIYLSAEEYISVYNIKCKDTELILEKYSYSDDHSEEQTYNKHLFLHDNKLYINTSYDYISTIVLDSKNIKSLYRKCNDFKFKLNKHIEFSNNIFFAINDTYINSRIEMFDIECRNIGAIKINRLFDTTYDVFFHVFNDKIYIINNNRIFVCEEINNKKCFIL